MSDYTAAWGTWDDIFRRRDNNPVDAAKQFLREQGWIVERPETLSLPVKVARSGSFTEKDGFRVTLHTRVNVGDRLMQVDNSIDIMHAQTLLARAFIGATAAKFQRAIMDEIEPAMAAGFEREIDRAKRNANG
jgi:hypothetical protein